MAFKYPDYSFTPDKFIVDIHIPNSVVQYSADFSNLQWPVLIRINKSSDNWANNLRYVADYTKAVEIYMCVTVFKYSKPMTLSNLVVDR